MSINAHLKYFSTYIENYSPDWRFHQAHDGTMSSQLELPQASCFTSATVDTTYTPADIIVESVPDYLSSDQRIPHSPFTPQHAQLDTTHNDNTTHGDATHRDLTQIDVTHIHEQVDVTASSDSDSYTPPVNAAVSMYTDYSEDYTSNQASCEMTSNSMGESQAETSSYNQSNYAYLYQASDSISKAYYNLPVDSTD